jgi:MarR family transcriptional repressor of emrRAB
MAHRLRRDVNLLGSFSLAVGDRIRERISAEAEVEGDDASCLVAVATFARGSSIRQLSRLVALSHSATVRLIDRLERLGLVRRAAAADLRSVAVVPTAEGETVAAQILEARSIELESILASLSKREREQLCALHEKLIDRLISLESAPARVCRLCDAEACEHAGVLCPVTQAADRLGITERL